MGKKRLIVLIFVIAAMSLWHGKVAAQEGVAGNLVGLWRSQVQTPWGMGYGETLIKPDGTFSKTAKMGDLFTWDVGRYTVGPGYIHFTIDDHEPKYYKGVRMQWVRSETVFFEFIGPDQLSCEDRVMNSRWIAYRAR